MKREDFDALVKCTDTTEFHLIGNYYYRAGTVGLSKHNKKFEQIGHCNYFREKGYEATKKELFSKSQAIG